MLHRQWHAVLSPKVIGKSTTQQLGIRPHLISGVEEINWNG